MLKKELTRYFILTITLFISALLFNTFVLPLKLVLGGNNGIAILLEYSLKINPSISLIIIAIIFLILSYFLLDRRQTISILYSSFIYPLFVTISYPLSKYLSFDLTDTFLIAIYIGLISGITNGTIIKLGFNNGGINVLANIIYKYFRFSYSKSIFIINTFIVLTGSFSFGINNILYAILILYINSYVVNKIILSTSKYKIVEVITKKNIYITRYLDNKLKKDYTKITINKDKSLFMILLKNDEYYLFKRFIKEIDPIAFLLVRNVYDTKIRIS